MGHNTLIYADNAATTSVLPEVLIAMLPFYGGDFGNPSSVHSAGRKAKTALENSRLKVANCFGSKKSEIFFTSGGTESNAWAIHCALEAKKSEGKTHIITSSFEHHSILNLCSEYEKKGISVTYLPVTSDGFVDLNVLSSAITDETALVTIMTANNEIGTIQPIKEIGQICRAKNVLFHTDAVQAVGHIEISFGDLPVDYMSFSAHKFHGPKGVGGLYVNSQAPISPIFFGGEQERAKRAGTENIAGIAGLAAALEIACNNITANQVKVMALREKLIDGILNTGFAALNGSRSSRLPGNANFVFEKIKGETLLMMLDMNDICCSSGSACASGAIGASHVLTTLGIDEQTAKNSLRITLSHLNTETEIDKIISTIHDITNKVCKNKI